MFSSLPTAATYIFRVGIFNSTPPLSVNQYSQHGYSYSYSYICMAYKHVRLFVTLLVLIRFHDVIERCMA